MSSTTAGNDFHTAEDLESLGGSLEGNIEHIDRRIPFSMRRIIEVMSGRRQAQGARRVPLLIMIVASVGIVYEAALVFTSFLAPYRFPIPYAVPMFDIP